jgi:4-hydroxybenzoate polyprenyltransferase
MIHNRNTSIVADAAPGNLVDRFAPNWLKPFARLARWDRPIGAWLLFWPCALGAALAGIAAGAAPRVDHIALFLIGSFAMRGAGCTWNDIVDRDIDARVARTASRPLPSGQVTTRAAAIFLALQLLIGLAVLVQFNGFAILVGFAAVLPVITYPFMKRITWWPQVNLGICFSWGVLMAWAAVFATIEAPALLFYLGSILWVIGYDTVYALQDVEDDVLAGVHSTALLFGRNVRGWLAGFYAAAVAALAAGLAAGGAGPLAYLGLILFAGHLAWQVTALAPQDPRLCLLIFKSNSLAALILFVFLSADAVF